MLCAVYVAPLKGPVATYCTSLDPYRGSTTENASEEFSYCPDFLRKENDETLEGAIVMAEGLYSSSVTWKPTDCRAKGDIHRQGLLLSLP